MASPSRARLSRFLIVVTLVLVLTCTYIGMRTVSAGWHWALILIPAILLWVLPTFVWSARFRGSPVQFERLQIASYLGMALLSWLFVMTLLRDIALVAARLVGYPQLDLWLTGPMVYVAAFALSVLGYGIAMSGPRIREIQVPISGLPDALLGFRIAQITDLHVGPTINKRYVERVVNLVKSMRPDLTVLTGDIADGSVSALRESVAPLSQLAPSGRVYYVPGNHEYYWNIDEWVSEFSRLGTTPLLNRGESFEHRTKTVWVGGVTDPAAPMAQGELPRPDKAAAGGINADFRLLLSHRPEMAEAAEKAGFQLQLSGHTHGGQFFPWTIVASFFHEHFLGLMKRGRMWIYVGPGTGTWGPPARVGTSPEVTLLVLSAAS